MFRKLYRFPSSGEWKETPTLLGPLERAQLNHGTISKGPNRVYVSLPSPEKGNRSSFRNVVFWYLEFQAMNKFQKPSSSECYTTTLKPLRSNCSMAVPSPERPTVPIFATQAEGPSKMLVATNDITWYYRVEDRSVGLKRIEDGNLRRNACFWHGSSKTQQRAEHWRCCVTAVLWTVLAQ
jgi:hypothetical protein